MHWPHFTCQILTQVFKHWFIMLIYITLYTLMKSIIDFPNKLMVFNVAYYIYIKDSYKCSMIGWTLFKMDESNPYELPYEQMDGVQQSWINFINPHSSMFICFHPCLYTYAIHT